jgi:hypothetical protein
MSSTGMKESVNTKHFNSRRKETASVFIVSLAAGIGLTDTPANTAFFNNTVVRRMIDGVTQAELEPYVMELTGEMPTVIGGRNDTIRTCTVAQARAHRISERPSSSCTRSCNCTSCTRSLKVAIIQAALGILSELPWQRRSRSSRP